MGYKSFYVIPESQRRVDIESYDDSEQYDGELKENLEKTLTKRSRGHA